MYGNCQTLANIEALQEWDQMTDGAFHPGHRERAVRPRKDELASLLRLLESFKASRAVGFRALGLQGFETSGLQDFRTSGLQKVLALQGFSVWGLQGFRGLALECIRALGL